MLNLWENTMENERTQAQLLAVNSLQIRTSVGRALALTEDDFSSACEALKIGATELWALLQVQNRGAGFMADRRPVVVFERQKFSELTLHQFDGEYPLISGALPGGYGRQGSHQQQRLEEAMRLDRQAALASCTWGIGQVLGANARRAGFDSLDAFVSAMSQSEGMQLAATVNYLQTSDCDKLLSQRNWAAFSARFCGPSYFEFRFDVRLAQAHQRLMSGPMPDLQVREAQLLLLYQGFQPGMVDGVWGRFTASALADFVEARGISVAPTMANLPRLLPRLSVSLLH
jgi:N-acetylmuramidase